MTADQKNRIAELRGQGMGYGAVAGALGINENTVKTFCRRNGLGGIKSKAPQLKARPSVRPCLYCGKPVPQTPGRKEKKFCCDACRSRWWNSRLPEVRRKTMYDYVCPVCGKRFRAYGGRKYCSRECYFTARSAQKHRS